MKRTTAKQKRERKQFYMLIAGLLVAFPVVLTLAYVAGDAMAKAAGIN